MRLLPLLILSLAACVNETPPQEATPAPPPSSSSPAPDATGFVDLALRVGDQTSAGAFETTHCAAPDSTGQRLVYATEVGTLTVILSVDRSPTGDVPLDEGDQPRVTATIEGAGLAHARRVGDPGSLRVHPDFQEVEADLDLSPDGGGETAHLAARFVCR